MEQYPQHVVTNSYTHSCNVTLYAWHLAKQKRQMVNAYTLVMGAMLHDFYLYDIKKSGLSDYQHGISHPVTAVRNAEKYFELNDEIRHIILSHMWPLPFSERPRCKEAVLVSRADKFCAYQECRKGIIHIEDVIRQKR